MTEVAEQPVSQEAQGESKIAQGFVSARERVMRESEEISSIYRSITKPGAKDVYSSWVKNMDVVANSYSWGKDKATFRTKLLKATNRIVGVGSAAFTVSADLITDTLSWPLRKVPLIKHFIGTDLFKKHSMRMAESAKGEALVLRGVGKVGELNKKTVDVAAKVVGNVFKRTLVDPLPELRVASQYVRNKVSNVSEAILHPKPKAI